MSIKPYKDKTLVELIEFLKSQPGSRPKVIADALGISRQYVQKLLLRHQELFVATGIGPNRFYSVKDKNLDDKVFIDDKSYNQDVRNIINNHFYSLTPLGEELTGNVGFVNWCNERNYEVKDMRNKYIEIINKYYPTNFVWPIDFTAKLRTVFSDFALKKVWAVDYYNFEIFGKTKLGTQVMIAKQTADEQTVDVLIGRLRDAYAALNEKYKIDAVAFVSPTIQRKHQLMTKLEAAINKNVPRVKIHKVGARILIAQKTLKSIKDRNLNAEKTFVVESANKYNSVLIIDDALGSGATLNEIAKQMIQKGITKECYGLVLVASPSGYEIIQDV